ncbi:serine hydrolase [Lactiplantibacillus nangangensis]|uniref:Serine hydrolase n=1 Tax=Lactiplantibacillus nangangensis TaxID=2559917 RepID=A0ABW1SIU3_9LACO|nr:serine hydrolase [Lactiplantibacillus nangangensis]
MRLLKVLSLALVSLALGLWLWPRASRELLAKTVYVTLKIPTVRVYSQVPTESTTGRGKVTQLPVGQPYLGTLHGSYLRVTTLNGQRVGWVARRSAQVVATKQPLKLTAVKLLNDRLVAHGGQQQVIVTAGGPPGTKIARKSWSKQGQALTTSEFQVIKRAKTAVGSYYLLQHNQHDYGWVSAQAFKAVSVHYQPIRETTWRHIDQLITAAGIQGTLLVAQANNARPSTRSYGMADQQTRRVNTAQTVYPIASLQKAMTGVLIGQLVAQHRLSLNTTLTRFYPHLTDASQITIQALLNHTSGIWMSEVAPAKTLSESDAIRWTLQHLTVTDQRRWHYCSANYTLLAGIIRQVTGRSYAANLAEHLLRPAGMTQTMTWHQFDEQNVVTPYLTTGAPATISAPLLSSELGAGDIGTTVLDYYRFVAAFNAGVFLSPAMQRQLTAMRTNTYAAGLYYGVDGAQHATGFDNNISNYYSRTASGDYTVVLFVNRGNHYRGKRLVNQILKSLQNGASR